MNFFEFPFPMNFLEFPIELSEFPNFHGLGSSASIITAIASKRYGKLENSLGKIHYKMKANVEIPWEIH